jgi:hypothetical protein
MQTLEQKRAWYKKNKDKINIKWKCNDCDEIISLRSNKSWKCRSCCKIKPNKLTEKERYNLNPEYYREKHKRAYNKNKEEIKAKAREYRKTHKLDKEKNKERAKRFSKTEKWKLNSKKYNSNRRILLRWIKEHWNFTYDEWINLCNKYWNICLCCKKQEKLTIDHIIPISKWWLNTIDNIQPLCFSCNSSKRANTIDYRKK